MNDSTCGSFEVQPFGQEVTLGEALLNMQSSEGALSQQDVPLIIKLVENPKYQIPCDPFPGRVSLWQHDCIHILLNCGMSSQDEAFVIGFTMGSSKKLSLIKQKVFLAIVRFFYPRNYRFSREEEQTFRRAAELGALSSCPSLADVDFKSLMYEPIGRIRASLGLEPYIQSAESAKYQ